MATNSRQHIRRCHVCGTVNEIETGAVEQCSHCRKHLAPFYYFDESELEGMRDNNLEMSLWRFRKFRKQGQYHPLWGLSAYWDDDVFGENSS